ncbi:BPSL1445 family SYLF domain-containing lipoprotein [Ottowia testudinis]|uniref:Twin-arginine translocation pathway signal n=1 Tax=Ottowia testudinis TaxID=2816950 RepID=A0A975CH46_9BURK|nr:YSC84-related protein [Ottowia testudinis]QTD44084.1 twin-arginine translocation pathway signal [Ottowia testudinis]
MNKMKLRGIGLAVALGLGSIAMVGCTTTPAGSEASGPTARAAMDRDADATLSRLYSTVPGTREMVQRAAGVLVFPAVVGGSFVVGAEHGRGALREGGRTTGYYSTTAGSIGFQAGGQSKAVVYVFNTAEALQKFKNSNGWTAGADATVAVGKIGANGSVDTETVKQAVSSFILTNVGLEAGAAVGAAKVTRISL